jgi:xylulokinase
VIQQLSGRAVQIPDAADLVAFGAAAQAAATLTGDEPDAIARRWDCRRGTLLDPVAQDGSTVSRIREVRSQLSELNE